MASRRIQLGAVDGKLAPCPASPNCVSTQADDPRRRMAPISFRGSAIEAVGSLVQVLEHAPRARVVAKEDNYVRAEFTTAVFRFVDDVEFLIDETAGVIHFRSASRVGRWDFGANRRRMTRLRRELERRLGLL